MSDRTVINGKLAGEHRIMSLTRVAAYCRVSTDSAEQAVSYESQMKYYKDKIRSTPGWVLVDIYADEGITGTSFEKRKGFQRMIDDCMSGKIDMVITKSLSRFSRNTEDTLKYVRMLRDKNIPIVFEEEHINTCSMEGELLLTILGAVYQQEVENTSSHVRLGMKMKMKRGEMIGQPRAYGYDYDKNSKELVINPKEAEVVRWIFEQYVAGKGGRRIALELEERGIKAPKCDYWNNSVIIGIIKNVKYRGDLLQGKTYRSRPIQGKQVNNFGERDMYYASGHHEPIVSAEMFDKAQEVLRMRRERYGSKNVAGKHRELKTNNIFSQKLFCANCGKCLVVRHRGRVKDREATSVRLQCSGYANHNNGCKKSREWDSEWIERAFVKSFNLLCRQGSVSMDAFLKTMKAVFRKKERSRNSVGKDLKRELKRIQEQMNLLLNQKLDGLIENDLFQARYSVLRNELESAEKICGEVNSQVGKGKKLEVRIREIQERLRKHGPLEKFDPAVFEAVVDSVVVGDLGEGESEYITFIYRDGEKNTFELEKFRRAVELKRQLNKVSAYQENDDNNSCEDLYTSASSNPDSGSGSINSVNRCLQDKMDTMGGEGEPLNDIGVHDRPVKVAGDCNTCSVNGYLHYVMDTNMEKSLIDDCLGTKVYKTLARNDCNMQSVNEHLHYSMDTKEDEAIGNTELLKLLEPSGARGICNIQTVNEQLRDSMDTLNDKVSAVDIRRTNGFYGWHCNTQSVNDQLHYKMSTRNDSSEVCARDYGKRRFFRDGKNCSMQGLIHGLRYEMSQLGEYVCIMEFELEERYYRYLNSYKGGHEAKVMERIRILVLIPF